MPPTRYRSILLDLYGAFVRDLGGWIAVADLVALAAPLGVDERAVRSSVSRFARKGLLLREVRDGHVGYALSHQARALLGEGDLRIYDQLRPARLEEGWVLTSFSVPEQLRAERHQLRTRLTWLGFGNLGPGLWIAPRRVLDRAVDMIREVGLEGHVDVFEADYRGFDDLRRLIDRCWDLDRLGAVYTHYLERFEPLRDRWWSHDPATRPAAVFVDYVAALHEWRKTPYLDPGLPTELLPATWPGARAGQLFSSLRERLEPAARAHVDDVVSTPDDGS